MRHNFGPRYLRYNLPPEVVASLEDLYFVKDPEDLAQKYAKAKAWFQSAIGEVDKR
jgi:hypothetical protein